MLTLAGGTPDSGDGTEFYGGTIYLVASLDACGTFTFDLADEGSYLADVDFSTISVIREALHIEVACAARVSTTCPDNCAIDARYPHDPFNPAENFAWDSIYLRSFGLDVRKITCADLSTRVVGGAGTPPSCHSVEAIDDSIVTVQLSGPIGARRWTCIEYIAGQPGANEICIGSLPGDVNADLQADGQDLLALVDHIQFGGHLKPWQCDLDRDGSCNQRDLLALVDMLTGANGFPFPWFRATISLPCPAASLLATCRGLPLPD